LITISQLAEYYWSLKSVYKKHIEIFGRGAPDLPALFTEELCRSLFRLKKSEKREYDAIDSNCNKIEIKATSNPTGTTTLSSAGFDYLYWLYFNFNEDTLTVRIIPSGSFQGYQNKKNGEKDVRRNVRLNNYISETDQVTAFRISEDGFTAK